MELLFNPITLTLLSLGILIYSAILHEIAHGYVADRLGDPTARLLGRLTLNPVPHIDPILSLLVPLLLFFSGSPVIFGGAKPVPVDPFNLRDGRKDMALVSLAGPLTNLTLALIGALFINLLFPGYSLQEYFYTLQNGVLEPLGIFSYILFSIVYLNLLLAIFNLLPIPPLDGSKIFSLLLPEKEANAYLSLGTYGMFILFFLLMFPIGGFSLGSFIFGLMQSAINILIW